MSVSMADEVVYVNGEFCRGGDAKISIYDRGFLMADAVYEVSAVVGGKLIDNDAHLRRLMRSLRELSLPLPCPLERIVEIQKEIIRQNAIQNGEIYLQVTRGCGARDFLMKEMTPTLVMFPLFYDPLAAQDNTGIRVKTYPDIRWLRRDIKTTQLLAQSLARSNAAVEGFDDAWLVDDNGFVTEGSANNAWIIRDDKVFTRPANHEILNGITRQALMRIMRDIGLEYSERAFTVEEALAADEAFITSAANWATPVINIDGHDIGDGTAGRRTLDLRDRYIAALDALSS